MDVTRRSKCCGTAMPTTGKSSPNWSRSGPSNWDEESGTTRILLPCSRSAHTRLIRFEIKGGAPSTGAVGATCVSFLGETASELRRMIGIDLRTVRLAIAALGRGRVPGNRLRSNRWVGRVEKGTQGWAVERTRTFETDRATLMRSVKKPPLVVKRDF